MIKGLVLVMVGVLKSSKALAFIFFVVGVLPPEEIAGLRRRRLIIDNCVAMQWCGVSFSEFGVCVCV